MVDVLRRAAHAHRASDALKAVHLVEECEAEEAAVGPQAEEPTALGVDGGPFARGVLGLDLVVDRVFRGKGCRRDFDGVVGGVVVADVCYDRGKCL